MHPAARCPLTSLEQGALARAAQLQADLVVMLSMRHQHAQRAALLEHQVVELQAELECARSKLRAAASASDSGDSTDAGLQPPRSPATDALAAALRGSLSAAHLHAVLNRFFWGFEEFWRAEMMRSSFVAVVPAAAGRRLTTDALQAALRPRCFTGFVVDCDTARLAVFFGVRGRRMSAAEVAEDFRTQLEEGFAQRLDLGGIAYVQL